MQVQEEMREREKEKEENRTSKVGIIETEAEKLMSTPGIEPATPVSMSEHATPKPPPLPV